MRPMAPVIPMAGERVCWAPLLIPCCNKPLTWVLDPVQEVCVTLMPIPVHVSHLSFWLCQLLAWYGVPITKKIDTVLRNIGLLRQILLRRIRKLRNEQSGTQCDAGRRSTNASRPCPRLKRARRRAKAKRREKSATTKTRTEDEVDNMIVKTLLAVPMTPRALQTTATRRTL